MEAVLAKLNPGIFCCLNTNLKDNVEVSDITKKGYQTFKQNVSGGMGGIVLYLNHFLNPSLVPDYISQDFENIWVSFEFPDLYEIDQRKEKISSVLGVLREPPTNAKSFYSNLADTTNQSKLKYSKYDSVKLNFLVIFISVISEYTHFLVICQVTSQAVEHIQPLLIGKCDNRLISANQRRYLVFKKGKMFANGEFSFQHFFV